MVHTTVKHVFYIRQKWWSKEKHESENNKHYDVGY